MSRLRRISYPHALDLVRRAALETIDQMTAEFEAEDQDEFDREGWSENRQAIKDAPTIAEIIRILATEYDHFDGVEDSAAWIAWILIAAPKGVAEL